jgi:hypothetical protein
MATHKHPHSRSWLSNPRSDCSSTGRGRSHRAGRFTSGAEKLAQGIRQAPDLLRRARNQRVHSLQVTDVLEVALGVRVGGRGAAVVPAARARSRGPAQRGDAAPHAAHRGRPATADRAARRLRGEQVLSHARRRSCSPAGCASRPAGATTCGGWCKRRCRRSTATRGGLLAWALAEPETRLGDAVSGIILACSARIVYTSPAEPRGCDHPRREWLVVV